MLYSGCEFRGLRWKVQLYSTVLTTLYKQYIQCGTFTGIIPVLALFLIKFEWYWYLVFEVVFEVFFDCFGQLSLCPLTLM